MSKPASVPSDVHCIVLDAMGVIFRVGEDVPELLIPFIAREGGTRDSALVDAAYVDASSGRCDPDEFWVRVGLSPELEDDYLELHELMPGATQFIDDARRHATPIWMLS